MRIQSYPNGTERVLIAHASRGTEHAYTLDDGEDWGVLADGSIYISHPSRSPFRVVRTATGWERREVTLAASS